MIPFQGLSCVDAFTDHAGAGNPAGVCLLEKTADPAWMQMVAREMNLSETAFVVRERDLQLHVVAGRQFEEDVVGVAAG